MDVVEQAFKSFGKDRGFNTRGRNYWLDGEDLVRCMNLQRSQWGGDRYYLNIGWAIYRLTSTKRPTLAQWDISLRLESLFDDAEILPAHGVTGAQWANAIMDGDAYLPAIGSERERAMAISVLLEEEVWPLLEEAGSVAAIATMLRESRFPAESRILGEAQHLVGLR